MVILPILFCGVLGLTGPTGDAVTADDLPATVKAAMERAVRGAVLSNIEKTTGKNGKVVYTAKYVNRNGKDATISVSEDGMVVRNGVGWDKKKPDGR